MKKLILFVLFPLFIVVAGIYILIPGTYKISRSVAVKANTDAVYRLLMKEEQWANWWPGNAASKLMEKEGLLYKDQLYKLDKKLFYAFSVQIIDEDSAMNSIVHLLPVSTNSVKIEWTAEGNRSGNFFNVLPQYIAWKRREDQMGELLQQLQSYLNKPEHIYGSVIQEERVKDSVIVTSNFTTNRYPTTAEIYELVNKIKSFVKEKGATETGHPMLNIKESEKGFYIMVGIPVNTNLNSDNKAFQVKKMVLGNILTTEVMGGPYTVQNALTQMRLFINDNKMASPAIPFESLVTNRLQQPDSTQWITKIYYPVF